MTLTRRALVVIFPVVLVSNLLIAFTVYTIQLRSIEAIEVSRLRQMMGQLKMLLDTDITANHNLVFSQLEGEALRAFMREEESMFRITALGVKVQNSVAYFSRQQDRFVSFALLARDLGVTYYFENSADPFAEIRAGQVAEARRLLAVGGQTLDAWVDTPGGPLVIHSALVDPVTFSPPLPAQRNLAVVVQAAVEPRAFLDFKAEIEGFFGSPVLIARATPLREEAPGVRERVTPDLELALDLTPDYLRAQMAKVRNTLVLGGLGLSIVTLGLLLALVRRTITGPIASLDRQVTEVISGARDTIRNPRGGGEIGRLTHNIKAMHDAVTASLSQVKALSLTDSLTGISNRLHFQMQAEERLATALTRGETLGLLFVDLDNFKYVNDTFGHAAGDSVLRSFAGSTRRILDAEPPGAVFARLSGDEFAILLPRARAEDVAALILRQFNNGMMADGQRYPVSGSIGCAAFPADATTYRELLSCADMAMYAAKTGGKNRTIVWSPGIAVAGDRDAAIKEALVRLDHDAEFRLDYMPIVDRDGVARGCEAMLRWNAPGLGELGLADFYQLAERHGFAPRIDRWMMNRGLADYAALCSALDRGVSLWVNISSQALSYRPAAREMLADMARHGVAPERIVVEFSETFAADLDETALGILRELATGGVRPALDDFGTGRTSLRQIIDYPLGKIKLSGALVRRLKDAGTPRVLAALVRLCHEQGRAVVGQGVEGEDVRALLLDAGCDYLQGPAIGPAMTLSELRRWRLLDEGSASALSA